MDGKEIFKEILKSLQMKELLGVSPDEEIHEDYENSSQHPEISVVQSIITTMEVTNTTSTNSNQV